MVGETKEMNENGKSTSKDERRKSPTRNLAFDIIQLGELQFELFKADLNEVLRATRLGVVLAVIAACLLLAATTVLLIGSAAYLEDFHQLSRSLSLLAVGGGAVVVSGILVAIGWATSKRGVSTLSRSQDELHQNLNWIKQTLSNHDDH